MDGGEDRASRGGEGGGLGAIRSSLRSSFRRVAEKSPLSPKGKGSKVAAGQRESESSPGVAAAVTASCQGPSPTEDGEATLQKSKGLKRSKTDPNMTSLGDAPVKRGILGRHSLRFSSRRDKNKTPRGEPAPPRVEEKTQEEDGLEEEEEVEVEVEEVEEEYVLGDIPDVPLSVMQISKMIDLEELEEAHLQVLALRGEFQRERERCGDDPPTELSKKEKDLSLLYGDLRDKLKAVVRGSCPSGGRLLVPLARIIQEEERRAREPGGLPGSWMEAWREAVAEGAAARVGGVALERKEGKGSWLAQHLGLLGRDTREQLALARTRLQGAYPPSFGAVAAYEDGYRRAIGQHLRKLEPEAAELKDLYALLDWIVNQYRSETILGSAAPPDEAEADLVEQLKEKYCCRVKEDTRSSLERIIELQDEELWRERKAPEKEGDVLLSQIYMDIWTFVKGMIQNSGQIDAQLGVKVARSCMEELELFPRRFEAELRRCCGALRPQPLWAQYHITYVNSFAKLQQHMDEYEDACPEQVDAFRKEVKWLTGELTQQLEDEFKLDVTPYLRRMMTRKWMTNDEDFRRLHDRTMALAEHCSLMVPLPAQELASRLHYHVVREYVGQLVKSDYSCKNRKHEKAAAKMSHQWEELRTLFKDMNSTHEWLHHAGEDLSNLVGQRNKRDIKACLQPLVEHYPDFSRKHLVAVLYFRGLSRGREHRLILQRLSELRRKTGGGGDKSRALFTDMPVMVNTGCLSNLPSCFSMLLPHG